MPPTRRQFIKSVGVTLGSLIVARYVPACTSQRSNGGPQEWEHPAWDRLRQCWLDLDSLADQSVVDWDQAQAELDEREAAHWSALDALVEVGEVETAVADQMQVVFAEAAYHVWRSNAPISCYFVMPFGATVGDDLLGQLQLLRQAAGDLDPAAVEEVQAAIERDIAFLETVAALQALEGEAYQEAQRELIEQFNAGQLEASPEAVAAAHILISLLLGGAR